MAVASPDSVNLVLEGDNRANARLFDVLHETAGATKVSPTFCLPDLRGLDDEVHTISS